MANVAEMQASIKLRADDLREELADLAKWEDEIKQKDRAIQSKTKIEADLPAIRGTPKPAAPAKPKEDPIAVAKEQGNEYFKVRKYDDAIRCYTKGIDRDPHSSTSYVLYGNRAMCQLKLEKWAEAEKDATTCIQMNRTFPKGFYRRALARKSLGKYADARSDLETLLVLSPQDPDGERELTEVTALLQKQSKSATSTTGKKKKKLVIEEVEDEEATPDAAAAVQEETRRKEFIAQVSADADAAKRAHEEQQKRQAAEEEARRRSQRKVNPRVEEIEDEESPKKPVKKATPASFQAPKTKTAAYTADNLPQPKNFSDFEKIISDLHADVNLKDNLFASIEPTAWKSVFGSSMTPEYLLDAFGAASRLPGDKAAKILQGVSTVNRLDEIVLFFDDCDRDILQKALDNAKSSMDTVAINALRSKLL